MTTIIFANRKYAILMGDCSPPGPSPGRRPPSLFDLGAPAIDWVGLAASFGVEAARAGSLERFRDLFTHAGSRPGPFLIELEV